MAANIAHSVEAAAAFGNGAQAVGLFHAEMLYMDRPGAPSKMNFIIFCGRWNRRTAAALSFAPWISAAISRWPISISGGKQPFPGYRAVNLRVPDAVPHAAQGSDSARLGARFVEIMIPMISSMEEILWVKDQLAEARANPTR